MLAQQMSSAFSSSDLIANNMDLDQTAHKGAQGL